MFKSIFSSDYNSYVFSTEKMPSSTLSWTKLNCTIILVFQFFRSSRPLGASKTRQWQFFDSSMICLCGTMLFKRPAGELLKTKTKKTKSTFISIVSRVDTCLARTFNVWLRRHHDCKESRRRAMHVLNRKCCGTGYFMLSNLEPWSDYIFCRGRLKSKSLFFILVIAIDHARYSSCPRVSPLVSWMPFTG